jgi:hypothetical protein
MARSYFNQVIGGVSQLWVTDGTALGTHIVASLGNNGIFNLTTIGTRVFFSLSTPYMGKSSGHRTGPPPEPSWSRTSTLARAAPRLAP